MATLLEMASEIVASHASASSMTKEELVKELKDVHAALAALEKGESVGTETAEEEAVPAITRRKAFGKKQITCMICGKSFTTLTRHLKTSHDMSPKEYRRKFGIPSSVSLAARDYSEKRRQMAIEKDLGAGLAKARAARAKKKP